MRARHRRHRRCCRIAASKDERKSCRVDVWSESWLVDRRRDHEDCCNQQIALHCVPRLKQDHRCLPTITRPPTTTTPHLVQQPPPTTRSVVTRRQRDTADVDGATTAACERATQKSVELGASCSRRHQEPDEPRRRAAADDERRLPARRRRRQPTGLDETRGDGGDHDSQVCASAARSSAATSDGAAAATAGDTTTLIDMRARAVEQLRCRPTASQLLLAASSKLSNELKQDSLARVHLSI